MADRNGKAIAVGTDYALIGEALATSDGRVMVRIGNTVLQPDEVDIAQADDLGGGGVTDHGALTGLGDDDHTQYHTDARAVTWLGTQSVTGLSDVSDAGSGAIITGTERSKLAGIEAGAEVNNISDTNATDLTDGGVTTLHKHGQLDYYWFGRVQTSTGNHLIGPGGGGAHSIPSPVMRAGSTSYVSVVAYQNTYSGTPPDPLPVFYLELRWRASATRSTEGSVIAKTGTITFDWTATATNVPQRLKWLNPSTGADDVAPLSLAQLDSIYLDLVGDTSMAWGVSCYVEVDINA